MASEAGHGGRRPGAGRPGPRREYGVFVPLSRLERERLMLAANGKPLATWVREVSLAAIPPDPYEY